MIAALCGCASVGERHLSVVDLREIKRICATILGTPVGSLDPWLPLAPYARTPDALDRMTVICSAECIGTLLLLDGAEIRYSHPNTPEGWPGHGRDRIDSITLVQHGNTLLELPRPKT